MLEVPPAYFFDGAPAGDVTATGFAEPDGTAYVVDYKYSNAQNTKGRRDNPNLLQAPLYLMAVEQFFGLKGPKVIGFEKSGLAQSIYAELKQHRLNKPVTPGAGLA